VRFGIGPLDHSSIIADIEDVRRMLDMTDGASAILGLFRNDLNNEERATAVSADFNAVHAASEGKFVPTMITLRKASGLSDYMDLVETSSRLILAVFLLAMSIVLWNAGLTGSLRRYGELGLRLAVGEDQGHVYRSLIAESLMIGVAGSLAGTVIGVGFAYYLQVHGFDIGAMTRGRTMMVTDIVRAQVTPLTYVIGFIPGVLATLLGSAVSGLGIYKRQTSQLFKELET
jgi:putative ABC transport system permease protein